MLAQAMQLIVFYIYSRKYRNLIIGLRYISRMEKRIEIFKCVYLFLLTLFYKKLIRNHTPVTTNPVLKILY
jgi:hypothetical protein